MISIQRISFKESTFDSWLPRLIGLWLIWLVCLPNIHYETLRVARDNDFSLRSGVFIFFQSVLILTLLFAPELLKDTSNKVSRALTEKKITLASLLWPACIFLAAVPMADVLRIPHDSWIMGLKYIPKIALKGKVKVILYIFLGATLIHFLLLLQQKLKKTSPAHEMNVLVPYTLRLLAVFFTAYALLPSLFALTFFSPYIGTAHIKMAMGLLFQGCIIFLLWRYRHVLHFMKTKIVAKLFP